MHITAVLGDTVITAEFESADNDQFSPEAFSGWRCRFVDLYEAKTDLRKLTDAQFAAVLAMAIGGEDLTTEGEKLFGKAGRVIAEVAMQDSNVRVFP